MVQLYRGNNVHGLQVKRGHCQIFQPSLVLCELLEVCTAMNFPERQWSMWISFTVIKPCPQTISKWNRLFQLAGQSLLSRETKAWIQGRNLETEAETMEGWCLLTCSQPDVQLSLLYAPCLFRVGAAHSGLCSPDQLLVKKVSTDQSNWSNSSFELPSSRVTSLCQQN